MIDRLLPTSVVVSTAIAEDYLASIRADEGGHLTRAITARRHEFAAGRACAHRVLASLGYARTPVLVGSRHEPVWPDGITGSITHCEGYCAAAAAVRGTMTAIGIDAERVRDLDRGTVEQFCTPRELATLPCLSGNPVPLLVFSAKEAFFKAFSALAPGWLDFLDGEVVFELSAGRFGVTLLRRERMPAARFAGRFMVTRDHVFTAVVATVDDNVHDS